MESALLIHRLHFAFTATFHYLFPQLTMGLALLIVILKTIAQRQSLQKIGGNLEAEFDLAPGVFAKPPEGAHFLFVVNTAGAPHTSVGEYPVIVRARP